MHRQLKAAIMCHTSSQWTEALPLVLMGMRSSWKDDINASPAELVYGEPLCLPGQFISPNEDYKVSDVTQYATRLRACMANLTPRPTSWHSNSPFYIPRDLHTTSHVFIRQDHVRGSLVPPYAGPFKVVKRHPKFFTVEVRGKLVNVSIDRLKPAYMMRVPEGVSPTKPVEKTTRSGRKIKLPDYYRP